MLHAPALQVDPLAQACAQEPQLAASVCTLAQWPAHDVCPLGHAQAPAVHVVPVAHAWPHAPQFVGSACVSTQAVPHSVWPSGQPQWPATHRWPIEQAVAHAPQWLAVDERLVSQPSETVVLQSP